MRRLMVTGYLALTVVSAAGSAGADDWPTASVQTARSPSGRFRAVVVPAPATTGPARLTLFDDRDPARPRQVYQRASVNPEAPLTVLVGDGGQVVTLNEWGNVGYEHSIAIYDPRGKLVIDRRLEEILLPEELATKLDVSVSSRWWVDRQRPGSIEKDAVVVRTLWKTVLRFRLADGAQLRRGKRIAIPTDDQRFTAYATGKRPTTERTIQVSKVTRGTGANCQVFEKISSCESWGTARVRRWTRPLKPGELAAVMNGCAAARLSRSPMNSLTGDHLLVNFGFDEGGHTYLYKALVPGTEGKTACWAALQRAAGLP